MSSFTKMNIRPAKESDVEQLDKWRWQYTDADLEVVHGWQAPGVETAVAEKAGKIVGSLTAVSAVVIDPFVHDPDAYETDIYAAVVMLERTLAYRAQQTGAVDAYIAVPEQLKDYIEIVKRSGYEITCERCVILRRALVPETHPRLGPARNQALQTAVAEVVNSE